ncbi:MAG: hypothetical protein WDM77_22075 [Steroidobacteraceae bacterium]
MPAGLMAGAPLIAEGSIRFEEPAHPFELHLSHPTFDLKAKGQAAGARAVDADLNVGNVATLVQSVPAGLSGPLRLHLTAQQTRAALQTHLMAAGNLDSTLATLHPWLRGPENADIRASYAAGELKLDSSTASNKALSVTLSGRASAPKAPGAGWSTSGKTRVALADLSLLLPALSGSADIHADVSGTTAALRLAGELQAAVAMRNSAAGTLRGTFDLADLPHAPHAQVKLSGQLAAAPLTLQADVLVVPGTSVRIRLPHADWQSLHAEGDLTLAEDLDRSQGQLKWSITKLADLNELSGQHFAGSLTGALNLIPAGTGSPAAKTAQTTLQVTTEGLQIGALKVNATLTGSGPLHALQMALAAQTQILGKPAHAEAQAALDIGKSNLQLTALTGQVRGVDVKLLQPASVDFAHGLSVAGLRASLADAVLTGAGDITPQMQLKAELNDATPGLIDAVLPGYLASGSCMARCSFRATSRIRWPNWRSPARICALRMRPAVCRRYN